MYGLLGARNNRMFYTHVQKYLDLKKSEHKLNLLQACTTSTW